MHVAGIRSGLEQVTATGAFVLSTGLAAFVVALRVFEPRASARETYEGVYRRWECYVVWEYAWLALAALLMALESLAGLGVLPALPRPAPVPHLLAIGLVTMPIVGFGARALPLFEGRVLTRHWALDGAFVALNTSVAIRPYFSAPHPSAGGLAISGVLGMAGLVCYAIAVAPLLLVRIGDAPERPMGRAGCGLGVLAVEDHRRGG